jgi:hypothetical protein
MDTRMQKIEKNVNKIDEIEWAIWKCKRKEITH